MTANLNRAMQAFNEHKDNPVVQALMRFIEERGRKLDEVTEWKCDQSASVEYGYASFTVQFKDNTGLKGSIVEGLDGWNVRMFQFTN